MNRIDAAYQARVRAADFARRRSHPAHRANSDESRYASANYAMSFSKGLKHDQITGLVADPEHFRAFRKAIDEAEIDAFTTDLPKVAAAKRKWEAPTAGVVHDLQGPDAQAVTMLPAPELGSDELAYEMAEVYELALLRDVPLTDFSISVDDDSKVKQSIGRLNNLKRQGRPRKTNNEGEIDAQTAFRGSSPLVEVGPYLSQFLLIGTVDQPNKTKVSDGLITYGALTVDQRVPVACETDYMTTFDKWLSVQNGEDVQNNSKLFKQNDGKVDRRFISTPRDLATYVHYDALYQAYLNACLILLEMKAPTDPAFDNLSGQGKLFQGGGGLDRRAGGFALYGGPHILTLVTEVATRALKAVRYQKFNNHLRLRPEALAARIERHGAIVDIFPDVGIRFGALRSAISPTVDKITENGNSALLPMAFQEGSPMHPSYGAGHATVAGACVTILKAFFDTSTVLATPKDGGETAFKHPTADDIPAVFTPNKEGENDKPLGSTLINWGTTFLTLEGELNKLAANISIGRDMAGVHYFSDYYDSVRMGEEIAIGILEEQAFCYPTDLFVLTLTTFDGELIRIGAR